MRALLAILTFAALLGLAVPGPAPQSDTGRTLSHTTVIEAPLAEVWTAFTTPEGLKKSWGVALAEVDFRLGGTFRTNYNEKGTIGDAETITHHIIAYEPQRMLALRTEAPANAPEEVRLICEHGWTVIRLEPLGPGRTRATETMMGYQEGPLWDKAYAFFEKGNAWTHEHMKETLGTPGEPERVQKAWALLSRFVGGDWIHENGGAAGVFRVRNTTEWGPGHKSLVFRGWTGNSTGMVYHASAMAWIDPATDQVRYESVHEDGGVAAGAVTLTGENTIEWDWPETGPDGQTTHFVVAMTFSGPDEYRMVLSQVASDGGRATVVDATFHRVATTPAEFLRLRGDPAAGS